MLSSGCDRPLFDHDRLALISSFVAVAERASFAKAADALNVMPSTVSRHVARLESILNVRLLSRTTRRVVPTEAGQLYFQECRSLLDRLSQADSLVAAFSHEAKGLLRVSMPVALGLRHLTSALIEFRARHPGIQLEANYEDRLVDVVSEGYDVAIRIGTLRDSGLIARKLAPNRRFLVASPEYLEKFGDPRHPNDLHAHNCLRYRHHQAQGSVWHFKRGEDYASVEVKGDFATDNTDAVIHAVLAGVGIGLAPAYMAEDYLRDSALVALLMDWVNTPESNIYAVFPTTILLPTKVRLFIEFMSAHFRGASWQTLAATAATSGSSQPRATAISAARCGQRDDPAVELSRVELRN